MPFDYTPSTEEMAALQDYAKEHGRTWKASLSMDWYNARTPGSRTMPNRGGILHGLRNHPRFGPDGLAKFKLPKN